MDLSCQSTVRSNLVQNTFALEGADQWATETE